VTSSEDGTVRIWRARDLSLLQVLGGHRGGATNARFSPSGEEVLTGSRDGEVRVWDAATGQVRAVYSERVGGIWSLDWSRDGTLCASGSFGHEVQIAHRDRRARIVLRGSLGAISSLALDPSGDELTTLGEDQVVRFFDVRTGAFRRAWSAPLDTPVGNVIYDGSGRVLLSRFDGKLSINDARSGAVLSLFQAHDGFVNTVVPSRDGSLVVTAGGDRTSAVWSMPQEILRWRHSHPDFPVIGLSPDTQRVATLDPRGQIWDVSTGALLFTLRDPGMTAISWSHDGRLLVTSGFDRAIHTWSAADGAEVDSLTPQAGDSHFVAFTPDDQFIVGVGFDGVIVQSVRGRLLLSHPGHPTQQVYAAMAPDAALVAVSYDSLVYLYDLDLADL
jgi:WD40 repeat protein